jgi:hypothetical protein
MTMLKKLSKTNKLWDEHLAKVKAVIAETAKIGANFGNGYAPPPGYGASPPANSNIPGVGSSSTAANLNTRYQRDSLKYYTDFSKYTRTFTAYSATLAAMNLSGLGRMFVAGGGGSRRSRRTSCGRCWVRRGPRIFIQGQGGSSRCLWGRCIRASNIC